MKKPTTILLAIAALLLAQLAPAQQRVQTLRGADAAAADKAPQEWSDAAKAPGSGKPVARTFSTQPPLIPHSTEGFEAVTLDNNPCLMCHGPATYQSMKAPKMADSHFRDRDGKVLTEVSSARYQCMSCHVPQANAKPLVANTFRGDVGAGATKKK